MKIKKLRNLFLEKGEVVGNIEETFGNYDEKDGLIEKGIPTITTEFCEVGSYDDIVYFTFVIYSSSYNKRLFELLKNFSNFQIYSFENFSEDLYPKEYFNLKEFEENIKKEKYFQINFDYSDGDNSVEYLYEQYSTIKSLTVESGFKIVNQLEEDLCK